MPTYGELMPLLAAALPEIASDQVGLDSAAATRTLLSAIERCVEKALSTPDPSRTLKGHLEEVASLHGGDLNGRGCMRLVIAAVGAAYEADRRRVDKAWWWVAAAASEIIPDETQAQVMLHVPVNAVAQFPDYAHYLVLWISATTEIAHSAGYHQDLARQASMYFVEHLALLSPLVDQELLRQAACSSASALRDFAPEAAIQLVGFIESELASGLTPREEAKLRAFLCTAPGRLSSLPVGERARRLLAETAIASELDPEDHVLVASAALVAEGLSASSTQEVLKAVRRYSDDLASREPSEIARMHIRGRDFGALAPAVKIALDIGATTVIVEWMGAWIGLPEDRLDRGPVAAVAHTPGGVVWAVEGSATERRSDVPLVALLNQTLGLALIDTQTGDVTLDLAARPGVPDYNLAAWFQSELRRTVVPADVTWSEQRSVAAFLSLLPAQVPILALASEIGLPVRPLLTSLERPEEDRDLSRVDIWFGDILMAEQEAHIVRNVFERHGCAVTLRPASSLSSRDLLEAYRSGETDLIWVTSHAEFGHWEPDDTTLMLGPDCPISTAEIRLHRPEGRHRRLLVLNTCDSGNVSAIGGPSSLGLGAAAAGASQGVIAHLWPIRWSAGYIWAVLLAEELVEGSSFEVAFSRALRRFLSADPPGTFNTAVPDEARSAVTEKWSELTFLDRASPVFLR